MTEQEFISECMSKLKDEFSDEEQRLAVCFSKWRRGETKLNEGKEGEKSILLIFPRGEFFVEKYNEWLTFNDEFFNKIIDTFKNSSLPKPFVDIDHQEGEALGEVVNLFIDEAGLKGEVVFNNAGLEIIKNNVYRYISPSWGEITDNDGKKWEYYLKSISLTNIPALLKNEKVQKQMGLNFKNFKEARMKKLTYELSQITDDAVKKLVEDLINQGEKSEDIIKSLEAQVTELKKKLEEAQKQNEEVVKENEKMKEEVLNREAEEFIKKQLNDKKIDVAVVDYWKKQYKLNRDETIKYFETLEKKGENEDFIKLSMRHKLNDEDILVMKSLGMDLNKEEDVKFYLKINKKN
ncbi:MAG: hypothetical protein GYA14_13855 [Ignavibacteria bacterium]|nr:hypothetical protein [Ignavibacteria bacterium]